MARRRSGRASSWHFRSMRVIPCVLSAVSLFQLRERNLAVVPSLPPSLPRRNPSMSDKEACIWCQRRQALAGGVFACSPAVLFAEEVKSQEISKELSRQCLVQQMQGMADYERRVLNKKTDLFKSALQGTRVSGAEVVEVGVGTGTNFAALRAQGVERILGVEPNEYFVPLATEAANKAGLQLQVRNGIMEKLPLGTNSVDILIATLVLCSVDDVEASVREAHRVLRPGGRYVFTEHVGATAGTWLRGAQSLFSPLQQTLAAGCHLDREPYAIITKVFGKTNVKAEHWDLLENESNPIAPHFLLSPHWLGFATKEQEA